MKEIKLTQGKVAFVDDEDFDELNQHKWFAQEIKYKDGTKQYYAGRNVRCEIGNKRQKRVYMHRVILNTDGLVDHIDSNGLNNQRNNLRSATSGQNVHNQKPKQNCTSKYKGVYLHIIKDKRYGREYPYWNASIRVPGGKTLNLGDFKNEKEAALTYNEAAIKHFGEFAYLNDLD